MNSVERLVLEAIGEDPDDPDVFVEGSAGMDQIRNSVNDAIEEISMLTGGYRETYHIALRASRTFYRLEYYGGDIAWLTDAWLVSRRYRLEQTDLHKLTNFNPRFLLDTAPPRAYFPIGLSHIGVWPRPSTDSDILELTAVIVPARYTSDTDRLRVRNDLEFAAAEYAIGEYYASRGDAKTAIDHHSRYLRTIGIDMPYIPGGGTFRFQSTKEPWPKVTG